MKGLLAVVVLAATACTGFASATASALTVHRVGPRLSQPATESPLFRGLSSTPGILAGNPSESLPPNPDFSSDGSCGFGVLDDGSTCNANVAQATNNARSMLESLPALPLNLTAYEAMTVPEQLFVIVDVERVARGVPPIAGLTAQLDTIAQTGANNNTDPSLNASSLTGGAVIVSGGANWAGGTSNPLGTNYYWMYDDGPNSPNGDCTSAGAPGCWGHRDNILGGYATASLCSSYGLSGAQDFMGAGFTASGSAYGPSFAEILIGACGAAPTDVVFTWQQALQLLGGGTGGTVPGPPQGLVATTSTTHGVVLTWNAPASDGSSAVTGYELLRGKASGKERELRVVSCAAATCTFHNTGTTPGTKYFYEVEAINAAGTGPLSNQASAVAR
jgi:hypothetical protein